MYSLYRTPATVLLACLLAGTAAVCRAESRSAYRFTARSEFTGWQPVGPQVFAVPQGPGGAQGEGSAQDGAGVQAVPACPRGIGIHLEPTTVHYEHIVGAADLSADIRCTISADRPVAFYLDDQHGKVDLLQLPRVTRYIGGPSVRIPTERDGIASGSIQIDWAVKSVSGPEYPDFTPGAYGDWGDRKGISGIFWVFDRSLPGSVAFNLRNNIRTTDLTPPGEYRQSFRVVAAPLM